MNRLSSYRAPSRSRSLVQALPYVLVGLYVALLIFAALCGSSSMILDSHQHPHHNTHHLILCSWACHVGQTSTGLQYGQFTFALLLLTVSVFSLISTWRQRFPIFLPTTRGPPVIS
ncbi:MAG: hypothetical protein AB7P17_13230 [Nitrospirales bacterium]|nr:hypothetical protein [Nitrospirales bacterium]